MVEARLASATEDVISIDIKEVAAPSGSELLLIRFVIDTSAWLVVVIKIHAEGAIECNKLGGFVVTIHLGNYGMFNN